jgi:hypothetical protein
VINVTPFIERRCSVEQGGAAYRELKDTGAYTVLLEYPIRALIAVPAVSSDSPQSVRARRSEELRIGCIGAGSFARAVIFPALRQSRAWLCTRLRPPRAWPPNPPAGCLTLAQAMPAGDLLQDNDTDAVVVLSPAMTAMRNTSLRPFPITSLFSWKNRWPSAEQLEEVKCAYQAEKERHASLFCRSPRVHGRPPDISLTNTGRSRTPAEAAGSSASSAILWTGHVA